MIAYFARLLRSLAFWKPRSELYVFGTSILWGQGHRPEEKIHVRVRDWLESQRGERVRSHLLAHSGAQLADDPSKGYERLHGEVPTPWPSISAQVAGASPPKNVKVRVLVDGGINTVGGFRILDPRTPADVLESLIEEYCYGGMGKVLGAVSEKFPTADIYVLGYYQILSDRSDDSQVDDLLKSEGVDGLGGGEATSTPAAMSVSNCRLFHQKSTEYLRRVVGEIDAGHGGRCRFVDSGFAAENGLFGSDPLLFSPWTKDPMMAARARRCAVAIGRGRTGAHCFLAATFHPDSRGVDRYAQSLIAAIETP